MIWSFLDWEIWLFIFVDNMSIVYHKIFFGIMSYHVPKAESTSSRKVMYFIT